VVDGDQVKWAKPGQGKATENGCQKLMLAVFRSKIWSVKIHCSISFVFGNNCPIID
jgi:hypothetical protein